MDCEPARVESLLGAVMVIAAVLGSAVGGSFVMVQDSDLCQCRAKDPGIGNLSTDSVKVMDETRFVDHMLAARNGGHHKEVDCTVGSGTWLENCRSC